jgi:hypothetical protein
MLQHETKKYEFIRSRIAAGVSLPVVLIINECAEFKALTARESHDIGNLIGTAFFEHRRIAVDLPSLFVARQRSSIDRLARFPVISSNRSPERTAEQHTPHSFVRN